jgi:hypothetical protein
MQNLPIESVISSTSKVSHRNDYKTLQVKCLISVENRFASVVPPQTGQNSLVLPKPNVKSWLKQIA